MEIRETNNDTPALWVKPRITAKNAAKNTAKNAAKLFALIVGVFPKNTHIVG